MSFKEVKISEEEMKRIRDAEAKLLNVCLEITEKHHEKVRLSWLAARALNAELLMMAVADLLSSYVKIRTETAFKLWKMKKGGSGGGDA